jgi:hypothetical protein
MGDMEWDLFISHASADKVRYVEPLTEKLARRGIKFWFDANEITWGANVVGMVNQGLQTSRFILLCLSSNFLKKTWPESELTSAMALQNRTGEKRVLPLILNSKAKVLARYPLLESIAYREYVNPEHVADQVAKIVGGSPLTTRVAGEINVVIESMHTGKAFSLQVSARSSLKLLGDQARNGLGLSVQADAGGYEPMRVNWVLVQDGLDKFWRTLSSDAQRSMYAVIGVGEPPRLVSQAESTMRLEDAGVVDGAVFHMYGVAEEIICAAPPVTNWFGDF